MNTTKDFQRDKNIKSSLESQTKKVFAQITKQRVHSRSQRIVRPFVCTKCERRFCSNGNLLSHQRIHTGRPFVCNECEKCFWDRRILILHQRLHTGERLVMKRPFTCTMCNRGFLYKRNLHTHQQIHKKEKPFGRSLLPVLSVGKSTRRKAT
ncbi:uncharacterized protein WCC33_010982 [Rhinophrynus dorsalis]